MSTTGLILSAAQLALVQKAFIRPKRGIGGIEAHVVLRERHNDELEITEHPIERGGVIADHAFKRPAEVTVECGWSNSPPATLVSFVAGLVSGKPPQLSVQEVYTKLLDMQNSLELIDVLTGKRSYKSMLIRSLNVETDPKTENALLVSVTMRQINLASTQVLTLAPGAGTNQADPSVTKSTAEKGVKTLANSPYWKGPR